MTILKFGIFNQSRDESRYIKKHCCKLQDSTEDDQEMKKDMRAKQFEEHVKQHFDDEELMYSNHM